jgi:uncharacterized membrane protein YqjE
MAEPPQPPAGIIESFRKLGSTGIAVLHNRLELLSVELEEQKVRLSKVLVLAGAAIFLANAALLAISAAIVVLAGEKARLVVLVILSVVYILAALWAFQALRRELRAAAQPFQESISELKKDGEWLNHPH